MKEVAFTQWATAQPKARLLLQNRDNAQNPQSGVLGGVGQEYLCPIHGALPRLSARSSSNYYICWNFLSAMRTPLLPW